MNNDRNIRIAMVNHITISDDERKTINRVEALMPMGGRRLVPIVTGSVSIVNPFDGKREWYEVALSFHTAKQRQTKKPGRLARRRKARSIRRNERQQARMEIEREFLTPVQDTRYWDNEQFPSLYDYEGELMQREAEYEDWQDRLTEEANDMEYLPDQWEYWADDGMLRYYERNEDWEGYRRYVNECEELARKPENVAEARRCREVWMAALHRQPLVERLCVSAA